MCHLQWIWHLMSNHPLQQPSSYAQARWQTPPKCSVFKHLTVYPGSLLLTPDKILGTERTWLRDGRRNNMGIPVPFSVTKKISFEITIFKAKKHFYCSKMWFLLFFFFLNQNKSHACFGHLWALAGFREVQNCGIYSFILASAGLLQGDLRELKGPLLCSRVWALEHRGTSNGSTIKTGPFQPKGIA